MEAIDDHARRAFGVGFDGLCFPDGLVGLLPPLLQVYLRHGGRHYMIASDASLLRSPFLKRPLSR